jgi:tRNA pseudouridine38-40 synthase
MTHWKLTLAYDGTPFHGWQVQPSLPTVQGLLADAIHRTVGERVLPQGSGRTDAGVHALAQVASFAIEAPIPPANLHRALNRCLPPSIRILSTEIVPPGFHARHSALRKTYEYRIFPLKPATEAGAPGLDSETWVHDPICPPILAPYVWPCPWPLDLAALNQAAAHVLGTHDFTTFAATDPDLTTRTDSAAELGGPSSLSGAPKLGGPSGLSGSPKLGGPSFAAVSQRVGYSRPARTVLPDMEPVPHTSIRTITHSHWHAHDNLLIYRVTATGFLHHMVRNLVGTFVQAGAHRLDPDSIPTLLAARNRAVAGPAAPASGLFLVNVEYPDLADPTLTPDHLPLIIITHE